MQYGIKKESLERVMKAMRIVAEEIKETKEGIQKAVTMSAHTVRQERLERLEMSDTILGHIQESLEDFDFVLLDKKEYDYVSGYLMKSSSVEESAI